MGMQCDDLFFMQCDDLFLCNATTFFYAMRRPFFMQCDDLFCAMRRPFLCNATTLFYAMRRPFFYAMRRPFLCIQRRTGYTELENTAGDPKQQKYSRKFPANFWSKPLKNAPF